MRDLRKIVALVLLAVFVYTPIVEATSFSDVSTNHWAYAYITELVEKEVLKGFPDGTFKPDKPVSLSETFMLLQGIKRPTQAEMDQAIASYGSFAEEYGVEAWAQAACAYALEQHIITPMQLERAAKAGYFSARDKTYPARREIAAYYARALQLPLRSDTNNLYFKDLDSLGMIEDEKDRLVPLSGYVASLVKEGIFSAEGSEGNFSGNRPIRRSEIAKITKLSNDYKPPARPKRQVVIYTGDNCNYCEMTRVFLKDVIHTDFVEKNVDRDPRAREEYEKLGYTSVPMVHVDDIVIKGYNPYVLLPLFAKQFD